MARARRPTAKVRKSGGYLIAPAHAIPGDAPAENMQVLIEAANGSNVLLPMTPRCRLLLPVVDAHQHLGPECCWTPTSSA